MGKPKKKKIGRNDPCPCGSGIKFKRCCMNKYRDATLEQVVRNTPIKSRPFRSLTLVDFRNLQAAGKIIDQKLKEK